MSDDYESERENAFEENAHEIAYGRKPMPKHPSEALRYEIRRIERFMTYSYEEKAVARKLLGRKVIGGYDRFLSMQKEGVLTGIVSDFSACCYEIDGNVRVPYIRRKE